MTDRELVQRCFGVMLGMVLVSPPDPKTLAAVHHMDKLLREHGIEPIPAKFVKSESHSQGIDK
jgi:hypothetical protein